MTESTVFIATNDLAGLTRGRAVPEPEHDDVLRKGVGWVPADLALTCFGPIAENPFGSTGDLRLMPDTTTRVVIPAGHGMPGVQVYIANQTLPDGSPWECDPRTFARRALDEMRDRHGIEVVASFEHEFMVDGLEQTAPFSFERFRAVEPFGSELVALLDRAGLQPETWLPEYGENQFEITVAPSGGLVAADRAVLLKDMVRDLAVRHQRRVTFAPLTAPDGTGNGVHIHLSLRDAGTGQPLLYDERRPGCLSEIGQRFAAGILDHAAALTAVTAPSPVSFRRLTPHRWSAGGVFLAERNREALLRICPTTTVGGGHPAQQLNLEYRAADATANPYLAVGVLVRAGLSGLTGTGDLPRVWPEDVSETELDRVPALPTDLDDALTALEKDDVVSGWFAPDLLATHLAVKRAELAAVADLDPLEQCRRIASVY
ncbi:MAG: glutamine synthetase [Actinomycetes bacterium]